MMASQDSQGSSLLGQKQRVQHLSRDTFIESSASGLSTCHWEDVETSPGPDLSGSDLEQGCKVPTVMSQPHGRLATLQRR